jgi:hypothetical protein
MMTCSSKEKMSAEEESISIDLRPTRKLGPQEIKPSWAVAVAYLDELTPWGILALRTGILELIRQCTHEMEDDADPILIMRLRELTEALARLPGV